MRLPRIRKHILMVPFDGMISIGSLETSAIEIEDETGAIYEILKSCDGTNTIRDIYEIASLKYSELSYEDVDDIINSVAEYPYIMDECDIERPEWLDDELLERHSRNLNFLSNFDKMGKARYALLEKLVKSRVLIIGLGGVGSPLVYNLSALGVGTMIGVDFDHVDLTNLNRQILYREDLVGLKKAEAAKKTVNSFNSRVNFIPVDYRLSSSDDIVELIKKYQPDCVICAADKPPIKIYRWINEACHKTSTPWICGGNIETTSYYQTILPGESACYECKVKALEKNECKDGMNKFNEVLLNGYDTENNCTSASSSALASFMTFDAIRVITGFEKPISINKATFIDYRKNTIETEEIVRDHDCYCYTK